MAYRNYHGVALHQQSHIADNRISWQKYYRLPLHGCLLHRRRDCDARRDARWCAFLCAVSRPRWCPVNFRPCVGPYDGEIPVAPSARRQLRGAAASVAASRRRRAHVSPASAVPQRRRRASFSTKPRAPAKLSPTSRPMSGTEVKRRPAPACATSPKIDQSTPDHGASARRGVVTWHVNFDVHMPVSTSSVS